MLAFLCALLCLRFRLRFEFADLQQVIRLLDEIIQTALDHTSSRPSPLGRPSTLSFMWFQQAENLSNFDRTISTLEGAMQQALEGQAELLEMLTDLPPLHTAMSVRVPQLLEGWSERLETLTSLACSLRALPQGGRGGRSG